jgi:glycosyltransferase involved in cell wall biosynthesis
MVSPGKQQPSRKVLVLAPSLEAVGGVQRYVKTLNRALREILGEEGVQVVALGSKRPKSSPENGKSRSEGTTELGVSEKAHFALRALWKVLAWQPDLVVAAHVGFAPLAWVLQGLARCPYWSIAYGIEVWAPLSPAKRRALAHCARIICVSEFTRQRLAELNRIPEERIRLLPCVAEELTPAGTDMPPPWERRGNERIVLTVSRLVSSERYKGHDVLLQALVQVRRRIPDVLYLVVGEGDDRVRLEEQAQQLNLGNSVRFLGELSDERLAACYDHCDVFAMPSRTELNGSVPKGEGFGIVYLEAMMHGKPVIGPNYGAPTEFIRHGEHGFLVNPEDPEAVAAALVELLDSPQRARRMGEAAREWVMGEYSYPRFVERLGALLHE